MPTKKPRPDLEVPPAWIPWSIFTGLAGLALPLLLIPVVSLVGHSEIVEECATALVVLFLILRIPGRGPRLASGLGFGFLFGLSENALYFGQLFQAGVLGTFWERFVWTVPMHMLTAFLIALSATYGKKWIPLGLLAAIVIHLAFNQWIAVLAI